MLNNQGKCFKVLIDWYFNTVSKLKWKLVFKVHIFHLRIKLFFVKEQILIIYKRKTVHSVNHAKQTGIRARLSFHISKWELSKLQGARPPRRSKTSRAGYQQPMTQTPTRNGKSNKQQLKNNYHNIEVIAVLRYQSITIIIINTQHTICWQREKPSTRKNLFGAAKPRIHFITEELTTMHSKFTVSVILLHCS